MPNLRIKITATPELAAELDALVKRATDPALAAIAARAVQNQIRRHLFAYNAAHPNKLGGRRTNFYTRAAQSARVIPGTAASATIEIPHEGIAQRYYGGDIRPVRSKYLTIPAAPSYYGTRAREHKLYRKGRALFDATNDAIAYYLVRKVKQAPTPDLLPEAADMHDTALAAIEKHISPNQ